MNLPHAMVRQFTFSSGSHSSDLHRPLVHVVIRSMAMTFGLLCILSIGCGRDERQAPPNMPDASKPDASKPNEPVSQAESQAPANGASDSAPRPSEPKTDPAQTAQAEVTTQSEVSASANPAVSDKTAANTSAAQPAAVQAPPKPVATAEQIAKWNLPTSQPLKLLAVYDNFSDLLLQCGAISPDGKHFSIGGTRWTTWTFSSEKPEKDWVEDLKEADWQKPMSEVSYSPDGKWLAAGDGKGNVRIASAEDPAKVTSIKTGQGRIAALAFTPNSSQLATTGYSGEVKVWQVPDGKPIKAFRVSNRPLAELAFVDDDQLATAGEEVALWSVSEGAKKETLSTGHLIQSSLALSADRKLLACSYSDDKMQLINLADKKVIAGSPVIGVHLCFSADGRWLASCTPECINIWDSQTRQLVQVLDVGGNMPSALVWHPKVPVLMSVSVRGRVRLWGQPADAQSLSLPQLTVPTIQAPDAAAEKAMSPAQLAQVVDVRELPKLPDASVIYGTFWASSYNTAAPQSEIELFYRTVMSKQGWQEIRPDAFGASGLFFTKAGCNVLIGTNAASPDPRQPAVENAPPKLQVNLSRTGNISARKLPKPKGFAVKSEYEFFQAAAYRVTADISELEVAVMQALYADGWVPYTRIDAASREEPDTRYIDVIQGGVQAHFMISRPAGSKTDYIVQYTTVVDNKAIAVPANVSWIEYDSATNVKMVATTKSTPAETAKAYAVAMADAGWMLRDTRSEKTRTDNERILQSFAREGQDVYVQFVPMDGVTRVLVGDSLTNSWQLKNPDASKREPNASKPDSKPATGIEIADFQLPKNPQKLKYDVDDKHIEFELPGVKPTAYGEQFAQQMTGLGWTQDGAGIKGDDYTFLTFKKDKVEIQLRARMSGDNCAAMIGGDGLLWNKPIPAAPVRISYATWLRRNQLPATLELADKFLAEMKAIPQP